MDRIIHDVPSWGYARRGITSTATVVAADRGVTFDATSGTFDLALTAAATLGAGFVFGAYNSGAGVMTINPSGAETIRSPAGSAATLALSQGQGVLVLCDGTGFEVIASTGLAPSSGSIFPINVPDNQFTIIGSVNSNRTMKFEVDAQSANADLTFDAGAQTVDRTLTVPVLTGDRTLATIDQAQTFSPVQTFTLAPVMTALTASRLVRTDGSKALESNAALSNANVLFADASGWPTGSSNLLFIDGASPQLYLGSGVQAGNAYEFIRRPAGGEGAFGFMTGNSLRWYAGVSTAAEAGSNAGSDFFIQAFTDAAAAIDQPLVITRAAGGAITITRPLVGTDATDATSSTTGAMRTAGGLNVAKNAFLRQGLISASTSTATAAGTTTLTIASTRWQIFTGATTQNCDLPAANVAGAGFGPEFIIKNESSGNVTVRRAGADTIFTAASATSVTLTTGQTLHVTANGSTKWSGYVV